MSEPTKPTRPPVVIHGHVYQPPREDPWTGHVPTEPSAAPFHDWNERITAECYAANTAAQFGAVPNNNYEYMSYNLGPTLATWFDEHAPQVVHNMVVADAAALQRSGWGTAIAHPWVHAILPLCTAADRTTLIRWGMADFRHRFGRAPQGMWLPETAVDLATLQTLAAEGIAFTILAPHQLLATKHQGHEESGASSTLQWKAPQPETALSAPIRLDLRDGKQILAIVYDGTISNSIAFQDGLENGVELAKHISQRAQAHGAAIAATDMESYGHHHRFGDLALAACLATLRKDPSVELMSAAKFAATVAPLDGIIVSPSAWSCTHGIGRWLHNCGCRFGSPTAHNQSWRAPLRNAFDALRDAVAQCPQLAASLADSVAARDAYVDVIIDPSIWPSFAAQHVLGSEEDARTWLELQHHLLMMYSSCGWFFDDAAGHETLIVLRHARRAIELVLALDGPDLNETFIDAISPIHSDKYQQSGREIWSQLAVSLP